MQMWWRSLMMRRGTSEGCHFNMEAAWKLLEFKQQEKAEEMVCFEIQH